MKKSWTGAAARTRLLAAALIGVNVVCSGVALAQGTSPNGGALTFTGSVDVPSVYLFRGIVQEVSPRVTVEPAGDIGLALGKGMTVNFGVWHSLHTGSSGVKGATGRSHYEENFYTSFGVPLGHGLSVGTTFTAYTSPNFLFNTVKELSFKVASSSKYAPNALVAFELSGAADQIDRGTGTYLELGVGPTYRLGSKGTLTIPVKVGLSLNNYYQDFTRNERFGFFNLGGLVTYPFGGSSKLGRWDVHGGADLYTFGATTKGFTADKNGEVRSWKVVGRVGIGVRY